MFGCQIIMVTLLAGHVARILPVCLVNSEIYCLVYIVMTGVQVEHESCWPELANSNIHAKPYHEYIMPLSGTDNERPTFTFCPSDVTVYVQDNATSGNVTWTVPVAEDNVNVVSLLTTSSQGTYNVGSYSVVYSASDAGSNEELCSFTVEVIGKWPAQWKSICCALRNPVFLYFKHWIIELIELNSLNLIELNIELCSCKEKSVPVIFK